MNEESIGAKTGNFYKSLQSFLSNEFIGSKNLNEYAESLANTFDYNERFKAQQKKLHKQNDSQLQRNKSLVKCFFNSNQDYCEYCKLNYWPSNCTVFIVPKMRLSYQSMKLFTKYKLFNYKPKYKSYKDNLIKRILDRGLKLIYQCKRCKSRNLLFREINRDDSLKLIVKANDNKKKDKSLSKPKANLLKSLQLKKQQEIQMHNRQKMDPKLKMKKFQSLQSILKQNEIQEENLKKQKESSQASLSDFLQKLF